MRAWTPWHPLSHQFLICGRRATHRRDMEAIFRPAIDMPHVSLAEPYGILQDRIEDGLQAAWRRGNRAKDFRRCRLLLQRLPQLVQQPRVLEGDDGLRGKRFEKCNLLIRKRINLGTSKHDCSGSHSLA